MLRLNQALGAYGFVFVGENLCITTHVAEHLEKEMGEQGAKHGTGGIQTLGTHVVAVVVFVVVGTLVGFETPNVFGPL